MEITDPILSICGANHSFTTEILGFLSFPPKKPKIAYRPHIFFLLWTGKNFHPCSSTQDKLGKPITVLCKNFVLGCMIVTFEPTDLSGNWSLSTLHELLV